MRLPVLLLCIFMFFLFSCRKEEGSTRPPDTPRPLTGKTYSADEIIGFKQLTVLGEFGDGHIHKLPPRITLYLVNNNYPYMTRELDSIINHVNRLTDTNLIITRTDSFSNPVIQVYLTTRDSFEKAIPEATETFQNETYELDGLSLPHYTLQSNIYVASVFVDMQYTAGDTAKQLYLLRHEFTHVLGFLGHLYYGKYENDIMWHYVPQPYALSYNSFDDRMIQLLYNPAIVSGMDESQFNAVIVNL